MTDARVPRPVQPLTEVDARELLAPVIDQLCCDPDIGTGAVARALNVDPSTIRAARNMRSTFSLSSAANLLAIDPAALNPILAHYGLTAAPIDGEDTEDDEAFREMVDGALEVITEATRAGRFGRLCHQGKAAVLKAVDRLASARLRVRRGGRA